MTMKRAWCCLLILLFASAVSAADKHPFNLQDLHRIRNVSEPALSPDGIWLASLVSG